MKHKFAIIGAGWISNFYYDAYKRLSGSVELAGCTGNSSKDGLARLRAKK